MLAHLVHFGHIADVYDDITAVYTQNNSPTGLDDGRWIIMVVTNATARLSSEKGESSPLTGHNHHIAAVEAAQHLAELLITQAGGDGDF